MTNVWSPASSNPSAIAALGGDVTGTVGANTVVKLRGRPITATAPTDGQVYQYVAADSSWEPKTVSGGSMPGQLVWAEFDFVEQSTPGTYTAELAIAAGTWVMDVVPVCTSDSGPWACDSLEWNAGDTKTGVGAYYGNASNLPSTPYDPTQNQAGQAYFDMASDGNDYSASSFYTGASVSGVHPGVWYETDDTLTITLVTMIADPPVVPTGHTVFRIPYVLPAVSVPAIFTP